MKPETNPDQQYRLLIHEMMYETSLRTSGAILEYLKNFKSHSGELYEVCSEFPRKKAGQFETRAFLLRLCYEICSDEEWNDAIVKIGAAIEADLYSMYYLNRVFDEKGGEAILAKPHNQILAGMIMRDVSSVLLTQSCENLEKEKFIKIGNILDKADETVCAGQFLDLNKNIFKPDLNQSWQDLLDSYYKRSYMITASFYEKIALVGAMLGNGSDEQMENLANFAKNYGMMVQIINDISDFVPPESNRGTEEKIPDDAFSDIRHQKLTLPILFTFIKGTNKERFDITKVFMEKISDGDKLAAITELLVKNGAIAFAKNNALEYAKKAKACLKTIGSEKKKFLEYLTFQAYTNRYYKALGIIEKRITKQPS